METSNSNTTPFTIALETSFVIDCLRAKHRRFQPERYGNLDKDIDAAIEKHGCAA